MMLRILLLINLFFLICSFNFIYGINQHQIMLYMSGGYSKQLLDLRQNVYDTSFISPGVRYRWNKFLSRNSIHYFSIDLGIGGGAIFSQLRNSTELINFNSFLELKLSAGYGIALGKYKEHQVPIIGFSFLPRFYGLLERNKFTQVGGSKIEWYQGFYMPISFAIQLPSYRYIFNQFFIGFQHSFTMVVYGYQNINIPKENLILQSLGYQFQLELGLNYDNFSAKNTGISLQATTMFIETNRNGITISTFVKTENIETSTITIEIFALENELDTLGLTNLIGYASLIPVYNRQAQFTKHWKGINYFEEEMKGKYYQLYFIIKEMDNNNNILQEHFLRKNLEKKREDNENI